MSDTDEMGKLDFDTSNKNLIPHFFNPQNFPLLHFVLFSYGFDAPAGIDVEEGKAFNPYFPNGCVLAMPQQLFDEGIDYEDGTPATMSQQAKDICTFLRWAGEQWHDTRKRWAWKVSQFAVVVCGGWHLPQSYSFGDL